MMSIWYGKRCGSAALLELLFWKSVCLNRLISLLSIHLSSSPSLPHYHPSMAATNQAPNTGTGAAPTSPALARVVERHMEMRSCSCHPPPELQRSFVGVFRCCF